VDEIVQELQNRVGARGDQAHLYRSEESLHRIDAMETKLERIMQHLLFVQGAPDAMSMEQRSEEMQLGMDGTELQDYKTNEETF
jgi:hypothetical protein